MRSHHPDGDNLVKARTRFSTLLALVWLVLLGVGFAGVGGCADGERVAASALSEQPRPEATDRRSGAEFPTASALDSGWPSPPGVPDFPTARARRIEHAVLISVDGLAARYLEAALSAGRLPAFRRLAASSGMTLNARTDANHTNTLPNHTCMLTGLPVVAPGADQEQGHGYTSNADVPDDVTLHNSGNPARTYTPSVFDVVHDHGFTTAMFAGKSKFSLFVNSYNTFGAEDQVGEDDGRQKIDVVDIDADLEKLTDALLLELTGSAPTFTFVHFNQPDLTGHSRGWGSDEYMDVLPVVDQQLSRILDVIALTPGLAGRTALIVTTDHGGTGFNHQDSSDASNFVIPFFVMAPGIPPGSDLYALAGAAFVAPPETNAGYLDAHQPIRNGDAGNLALELLGLPPIDGSLMHTLGPALLVTAPNGD